MSTPTTISRSQRPLLTRRRMVRAAYDLFCATATSAPRSAPSPRRPAWRCQPSITRSTKAALLDESIGAAIGGFDRWPVPPTGPVEITEPPPWHGWWAEFEAASSSAAALDIFVTNGVGILQRVGPLITAMHGATGDTDAAKVVATAKEPRVDSYREAVRVIARKPGGRVAGFPRPPGPTWWSCCSAPSSTGRWPSAEAGHTLGASSSSAKYRLRN